VQRRVDRRTFIKQSAALSGGLALALTTTLPTVARPLSGSSILADVPMMTWYALDPEWGLGMPGCPVSLDTMHPTTGSCHACNACHLHGENKLFPTPEAADA